MKKITHNKATNIIVGNNLARGNTRYLWIRNDDSSDNYIFIQRDECNIADDDKFGNSQIHLNGVAASFYGR